MFYVRFWGVRGSLPIPGPSTVKIGGNTPCIEVRAGSEILIFDAGSGIRNLGLRLMKEMPLVARMFFTHFHWDHIQGFPFFGPAFIKGNRFDLFGARKLSSTLADTLSGQMNFPNFPVSLEEMAAQMNFHDLHEGEAVACGDAVITNAELNHPGRCFAYRVDFGGHAIVIASDTEHYSCIDAKLVALADGADVLIYDSMYTPEEYAGTNGASPKTGWGHSTWKEGVKVAKAANVRQLVLYHHDPDHDDEQVLRIESEAKKLFPESIAAYEGQVISIA
ncbi:MAG: MBL fold metallo-hydrolase [Deltaproteobacteria bacterium]|nr:MBL fold metallo-hydrolase [Deltaproteobacteria bacterium]